jgi:hypothetical protein
LLLLPLPLPLPLLLLLLRHDENAYGMTGLL